jgi:hypothetical protein
MARFATPAVIRLVSKGLDRYGHEGIGHWLLGLHILEVHGDGIGLRFAHDHTHVSSSDASQRFESAQGPPIVAVRGAQQTTH